MPLSLILSGLLAASAGMYGYLEYTTKTSAAKERIKEADKMEHMALKNALAKSVTQDETNGMSTNMGLAMSAMIKRKEAVSAKDLELMDKLQRAVEHMVIKNNDSAVTCAKVAALRDAQSQPYMTQDECDAVNEVEITLYGEDDIFNKKSLLRLYWATKKAKKVS